MKLSVRVLLFLAFNFAALAIGGLFTGGGVISDWYVEMNKAPWTPPGWVFGAAWTIIMICFSIYMGILFDRTSDRRILLNLYIIQLVLNIAWNPLFFYLQSPVISLMVISLLTLLILYFLIKFRSTVKGYNLLIVPYCVWLLIATSLNLYIVIYN